MKYLSALAAVLFAGLGSAQAAELLQNGSFETGDFSGWDLTDSSGLSFVQPVSFGFGAQSGNFYVYAGPPSSSPGVLSQAFSDTAGSKLDISGWAIGDSAVERGLGEISYFFDDVLLGSPDLSSGTWTQSTFQVTATGSDTFSIHYSNDASFNGLDNFSVAGSSVPEPSTWILLLIGMIGLAPFARTARSSLRSAPEV
jgi:hypothetical protein